jgi:hypothetical protein
LRDRPAVLVHRTGGRRPRLQLRLLLGKRAAVAMAMGGILVDRRGVQLDD